MHYSEVKMQLSQRVTDPSEDSALGPLGEPGPAREDFGGLALQNLRKAVGEDLLAHGPKGGAG
ncbi:hypothetical protein PR003_g23161 [Phytophthora rubi]|uniref:Uncharacterized protein n=1 Tax=Phytophthora rubi TaxID=129364 RepID=A0A6A4D6T4_9STRA|nr:hypothetical protein PR001_g24213 [Phytophthora rubi]KAE8985940.1 hypothetical protein PR002_g22492 [Phytophthora rubi]KAE9298733.1 hypothetical protein PR003_g23161 [Phytophthora rubi]